MTDFGKLILQYPVLYGIVAVFDMVFIVAGGMLLHTLLFRCRPLFRPWRLAGIGLLLGCCGVLFPAHDLFGYLPGFGKYNFFDGETVEILIPFACMLLLFAQKNRKKSIRQPLLSALLMNGTGVIKYLLCLFFASYNYLDSDTVDVFDMQFFVDAGTLLVLLGIYWFVNRKKDGQNQPFSIDIRLFGLIALTLFVFVFSLVVIGANFNPTYKNGYWVVLLNIPVFAVTIGYAERKAVQAKMNEENYKNLLDDQIRYYGMLERKNEELRIFRHDFPKKMEPLLLYIKEGNNAEAEKIVEDFNVRVQASRPRFHTGNRQLDSVLECQAQKADAEEITIRVEPGSVFPESGIEPNDIYTIFPNALDNAREACEKIHENAVISFASRVNGDTVFVKITNPYIGEIQSADGGLLTNKAEKSRHGYGYRSIRKTAAKYGEENVFFETENGVFSLRLALRFR